MPLIAGTRPAVLIFTGSVRRPALPRAAVSSSAASQQAARAHYPLALNSLGLGLRRQLVMCSEMTIVPPITRRPHGAGDLRHGLPRYTTTLRQPSEGG